MELLLINYLEDNRAKNYNDVSIMDYSVDGANCEVTFTHIDYRNDFSEETETKTISMWDVLVHQNYLLNK